MNIMSLDAQVDTLINDINTASKITVNELLKAKVSLQLTKINFGLKLINRVMKLYSLQETIEDRLLNDELIKDMSVRELLVMSSVNGKRLDNYFGKMDKILGSLNLRDLENSLLLITESDNKNQLADQTDDNSSDSLKALSMKLLSTMSQNKELVEGLDHSLLDQLNDSSSDLDEDDIESSQNDGSLQGFQINHSLEHDDIINGIESVDEYDDNEFSK